MKTKEDERVGKTRKDKIVARGGRQSKASSISKKGMHACKRGHQEREKMDGEYT